jgi:hypothetical protein
MQCTVQGFYHFHVLVCSAVAHYRVQKPFAVGVLLLDEVQGFQYVPYRLAADLNPHPHGLAIFYQLGDRSYLDPNESLGSCRRTRYVRSGGGWSCERHHCRHEQPKKLT